MCAVGSVDRDVVAAGWRKTDLGRALCDVSIIGVGKSINQHRSVVIFDADCGAIPTFHRHVDAPTVARGRVRLAIGCDPNQVAFEGSVRSTWGLKWVSVDGPCKEVLGC